MSTERFCSNIKELLIAIFVRKSLYRQEFQSYSSSQIVQLQSIENFQVCKIFPSEQPTVRREFFEDLQNVVLHSVQYIYHGVDEALDVIDYSIDLLELPTSSVLPTSKYELWKLQLFKRDVRSIRENVRNYRL